MIPRVIYTFWDGPRNPVVEHCLCDLKAANGDCRVVRLSGRDVPHTDGLGKHTDVRHVADWARLWYLTRNGGVWLDASCMCPGPVSDWVDFASDRVQGFGARWDPQVMENWAFACPAGSPLMEAWAQEFAFAIRIGFVSYKEARKPVLPATVYARMPYLTMHGAFCVVRGQFSERPFLRSPIVNGPLSYLQDNYNNRLLAVLSIPQYCGRVPFVKLRGPERTLVRHLHTAQRAVLLMVFVVALAIITRLSIGWKS